MNLKKLCAIAIVGCFAQHLSIAEGYSKSYSQSTQTFVQIACDINRKSSICESLNKLKTAEANYYQASDSLNNLESTLQDRYIAEVDPYIEEYCTQTQITPYMMHNCQLLNQLAKTPDELNQIAHHLDNEQEKPEQLSSQMKKVDASKNVLDSEKKRWEMEKTEWRILRKALIESICDSGNGPESFCDLLNRVKIHRQVLYQLENEQTKAWEEMKKQIHSLCANEKNKISHYYAAICPFVRYRMY